MTHSYEATIIQLIKQDSMRLQALHCVQQLDFPQCYLAAGFVRNLAWDHLHQYKNPTPLNDLDVIYFDPEENDPEAFRKYEQLLNQKMPEMNWQVRNQARMHIRNGDEPYKNSLDAMSHWPEKETAVAVRKTGPDTYECLSSFGFESLFNLEVTLNPLRPRELFEQRVASKQWLSLWPLLIIRQDNNPLLYK
ncbi:nucleotidyltransferase family protein [Endozoicomonas arenosclerae]|uniref:nucleotidyltransferase family protein n=1 Tax=Endozoicomonas arenosclerae TaxID=1633495 RepID=UPI00078556F4|nr:nucleotidyltransferase family protein [Endozoicomonas arenosclerae]